jgi:ankyrin repeat protein
MAAEALQVECAAKLIEHGAVVTQLTAEVTNKSYSVFALASKKLAVENLKQNGCWIKADNPEREEGKRKRTHEMLDLLVTNLPSAIDVVVDSELGSLIHYFAAVDYAAGIRQLATVPYKYPPDLENKNGETPYSLAIKSNSFAAIHQLLDLDVKMDSPVQTELRLFVRKWFSTDHVQAKEGIARIIVKFAHKGRYSPLYFYLLILSVRLWVFQRQHKENRNKKGYICSLLQKFLIQK